MNMTPSDWIAIGALSVAIVSIVINYFTNQANIKARRIEIATEKSIEAYRDIVEILFQILEGEFDKDAKKMKNSMHYHQCTINIGCTYPAQLTRIFCV